MPKHAKMFAEQKKLKQKGGRGAGGGSVANGPQNLANSGDPKMAANGYANNAFVRPGTESYRRTREDLTIMDKLHTALAELCYAINHSSSIHVWDHTFSPREYLTQNLENRFNKSLVNMTMFNEQTKEIAKPSELLISVRAYMNVLESIESHVHIDMTRVFNNVLLQQTQAQDSHGDKTITFLYTNWYLEVLLRKVSFDHIVYSPRQKAFVSLVIDPHMPFSAEEFSDINGSLLSCHSILPPTNPLAPRIARSLRTDRSLRRRLSDRKDHVAHCQPGDRVEGMLEVCFLAPLTDPFWSHTAHNPFQHRGAERLALSLRPAGTDAGTVQKAHRYVPPSTP